MIRVLVADDHPLVRSVLVDLIDGATDLVAVGSCGDGAEVVEMALRTRPDVVIMDLGMPVVSGIEATRGVRLPDKDR